MPCSSSRAAAWRPCLEQSQKEAAPLDLVEAARWTLQAAEALAHAHQRNVIHRDVKPSNLILDPAGQVWLTDFGLAKRMDDAALSMTGALLGTPRYMSPEQASAAKQPVDQRTDIYSLGATLYELATGKPLFEADSPHGIISQILTTEPPPPRSLRTGLPRDLETIILKCLAKEPQSRYATAQALADDLRAFCEGRAIKARRASIAERTVRWARKNRRSVAAGGVSAAAVGMLLVVGGIVISSQYYQSQLGHSSLKTDGPTLVAEVLEADQDRRSCRRSRCRRRNRSPCLPVPTVCVCRRRVVRRKPRNCWSTAAAKSDYHVGLKQQLLWDPISLDPGDTARVVNLKPDGWHVIRSQGREDKLSLLQGFSAQSVWEWSFDAETWRAARFIFDDRQDPPELVQPAPDLDGDGVGDLVWACRSSAALWAISGAATRRQPRKRVVVVLGGARRNAGRAGRGRRRRRWHGRLHRHLRGQRENVWIEAVSGKTGKSLWKAPLSAVVPECRAFSLGAQIVQLDGRPVVICVAGTAGGTRPENGQAALAGGRLGHGIDRSPAGGRSGPRRPAGYAPRGPGTQGHALRARPLAGDAKTALEKGLAVRLPRYPGGMLVAMAERVLAPTCRAWPWVADLDGAGKPDGDRAHLPREDGNLDQSSHRWGGVEVLDGATGRAAMATPL